MIFDKTGMINSLCNITACILLVFIISNLQNVFKCKKLRKSNQKNSFSVTLQRKIFQEWDIKKFILENQDILSKSKFL